MQMKANPVFLLSGAFIDFIKLSFGKLSNYPRDIEQLPMGDWQTTLGRFYKHQVVFKKQLVDWRQTTGRL